jgi:CubicO group peptidase (beta-lactamase class C family)
MPGIFRYKSKEAASHRIADARTVRKVFALMVLAATATGTAGAQVLSRAKPEDVGMSAARLQRVHDVVQRYIQSGDITGGVTLVARDGHIVYLEAQGVRDLDSKAPMQTDTMFRIASMTKPVTSAAIMTLFESGQLRLTDPVSRFIPEFKNEKVAIADDSATGFYVVPADHDITIRELLTHTSGLGSSGPTRKLVAQMIDARTQDETLATFIPRAAALPLDFQPGTEWRYSSFLGFETLARVAEVISGQTYDQFLRQRIFDPLGMKDTYFTVKVPPDQASRMATPYRKTDSGLQISPSSSHPGIARPKYLSGAGGLTTTTEDYARFAQMMLNGGELNGKRVLSPKTVALISSDHVGKLCCPGTGDMRGYGFGFGVQVMVNSTDASNLVVNGSYGWSGAFGTFYWIDPQDKLIGILMVQSSENSAIGRLHLDFQTAVNQAIVK